MSSEHSLTMTATIKHPPSPSRCLYHLTEPSKQLCQMDQSHFTKEQTKSKTGKFTTVQRSVKNTRDDQTSERVLSPLCELPRNPPPRYDLSG